MIDNKILAALPLLPPLLLFCQVLVHHNALYTQLLAYLVMSMGGYVATDRLIPSIQVYMLRKGICGKDLGKRGTSVADKDM